MKRVHVLELEDLGWFPGWLRTCMTNLLAVLGEKIGVVSVVGALVSRVLKAHDLDRIVDLGSGAGGVMPRVLADVRAHPDTREATLLMTDLHPNADAVARFDDDGRPELQYQRAPVDATDLGRAPAGLKTMVNAFHHMRPDQARTILASAQRAREPLLVYEMGGNEMPLAAWILLLPIALPLVAISALVLTPFVRPLSLRQLVFTYLVPIIPLAYAWDGQASVPRIYTLSDLDELLAAIGPAEGYRWEKGPATNAAGRTLGIYLLGVPEK